MDAQTQTQLKKVGKRISATRRHAKTTANTVAGRRYRHQ